MAAVGRSPAFCTSMGVFEASDDFTAFSTAVQASGLNGRGDWRETDYVDCIVPL